MRAKFRVSHVRSEAHDPVSPREHLEFTAVTDAPFDSTGCSDDNEYAKWTPTAKLEMVVTNPALFGQHVVGDKYYVQFTKAEEPSVKLEDPEEPAGDMRAAEEPTPVPVEESEEA